LIEDELLEKGINNLIVLHHLSIADLFGFLFAAGLMELKISQLYALQNVIVANPVLYLPIAKMRAVVTLVLGLRFMQSLGLIHSHFTSHTVFVHPGYSIPIKSFVAGVSAS
jgi:hypothetical protein